ncbi:MAG: hypothetical protein AAB655_01840 [Patescibacteria group bacterium]
MGENKDFLTKNLFKEPERGESGYLEPGYHRNERGEIEDDKGNVYDENYDLIREAPSEGLLKARKQFEGQDVPAGYIGEMAKYYQAEIDRDKKKASRGGKPPQGSQEDKKDET